jgi:hypothetical protein
MGRIKGVRLSLPICLALGLLLYMFIGTFYGFAEEVTECRAYGTVGMGGVSNETSIPLQLDSSAANLSLSTDGSVEEAAPSVYPLRGPLLAITSMTLCGLVLLLLSARIGRIKAFAHGIIFDNCGSAY